MSAGLKTQEGDKVNTNRKYLKASSWTQRGEERSMRHREWGVRPHVTVQISLLTPLPRWEEPQAVLEGKRLSFYPEGGGEAADGQSLLHPASTRPALFAVLHVLVVVALPSTLAFVQHFNRLHQVALEGRERGADGRAAKAVCEQAEVGEASLDAGLQAGGGPTAAQWGAVLGHQVHKLLTDFPERRRDEALVWGQRSLNLSPKPQNLKPTVKAWS